MKRTLLRPKLFLVFPQNGHKVEFMQDSPLFFVFPQNGHKVQGSTTFPSDFVLSVCVYTAAVAKMGMEMHTGFGPKARNISIKYKFLLHFPLISCALCVYTAAVGCST